MLREFPAKMYDVKVVIAGEVLIPGASARNC
jgi:hypothetical protein